MTYKARHIHVADPGISAYEKEIGALYVGDDTCVDQTNSDLSRVVPI